MTKVPEKRGCGCEACNKYYGSSKQSEKKYDEIKMSEDNIDDIKSDKKYKSFFGRPFKLEDVKKVSDKPREYVMTCFKCKPGFICSEECRKYYLTSKNELDKIFIQ
jgi:hypothetical protein